MLLTVAAGGSSQRRRPRTTCISHQVGDLGAVSVNFVVGTVLVLVVAFAFAGGIQVDEGVESPAWYYWVLGGLGGVAIVLTTLVTVRELGAGGVDRRGDRRPAERCRSCWTGRACSGSTSARSGWEKMLGIALLAAGTVLIVRE